VHGTVLVTGASKGIGEAVVQRLAAAGRRVYAAVRSEADYERWRRNPGSGVTPLRFDVTDTAAIASAAERVAAECGESGLDALVNNAGVAFAGPLEFLPLDVLRRQLEINVIGQVAVTQAFLPLIRRATGRIVFISSVSGRSALPFTGAYAASKFALEAAADALRVELRPWRIRVVLIEPGVIETPIWETSMRAALDYSGELPPEAAKYYGDVLAALARRVAAGVRGLPADAVARVVEGALARHRPKERYVVGRDARARLLVEKLLPTRMRDALVGAGVRRMARPAD
jgi:NAD(P)-dependent dehydrogenase (short-subunit alcohol dehydrogenase family)